MATTEELAAWQKLGGSVEEKTSGKRTIKTWIAPGGKKLKSWKEASEILKEAQTDGHQGRKRQVTPDVTTEDTDKGKKRQKKAADDQAADVAAKDKDKGEKAADDTACPKSTKQHSTAKQPAVQEVAAEETPANATKSSKKKTPAKQQAAQHAETEEKPAAAAAAAAAAKGTKKKGPAKKKAVKREEPKTDDEPQSMDEDSTSGSDSDQAADSDAEAAANGDAEAAAAPANAAAAPANAAGTGRRATQVGKYTEPKDKRLTNKDKVKEKQEQKASTEAEAVAATESEKSGSTRRLLHFTVVDEAGEMQHLDRLELIKKPLLLTGSVYPPEGAIKKEEGCIVAHPPKDPDNKKEPIVEKPFGPIHTWHVRYSSAGPTLVAVTAKATYLISKPAQQYRKMFSALEEQATLAWHVLQALDSGFGGNATASLDAVVAKLARAKAGKGYASAREALLLNGRFVLSQLAAHEGRQTGGAAAKTAADKGKGKGPAGLTGGPFATELEAELAKGPVKVGLVSGNSIKINDVSAEATAATGGETDALMAADEDLARRLQAKMDVEMAVGKGRGRGVAGGKSGAAYIKISEAEIADDYPMPQQYKAPDGVEETDELLLWDEELADCDPEALPKRLLTDFSIYNAEGFFASLELLPLWSGVDPDVELFASGIVKDDEGDWGTGGQPLEIAQPVKQVQQPKKEKQRKVEQLDAAATAGGSSAAAAGAGGSSVAGGPSAASAGGSSSGAGGSSSAAAAGSSRAGGSSSVAAAGGSSGAGASSAAAGSSGAGGSSAAAGGSSSGAGGSASAAAAADADAAEEAAAGDAAAEVAVDAGPDPVAEGGMRLYLSQIREWVVEFSADMLFISIRTDAAWYKLCRPNPKYVPWYGVPLKSARVAVAVINMLQAESRASRLSFADVVKRLSEVPPGSHTFISKRVDRVERYLTVHGQILLNQIKNYPNAAVQRAPFVSGLKEKMEMRKHSKLFYSKRGFSKATAVSRGVNRNPMKDRSGAGRPKPMPATTTMMVRSVWQNYFNALQEAGQKQQEEAAAATEGEVAKEVEDDPLEEDEQDEADAQEDALAGAGPASPKGKKKKRGSSKKDKAAKATADAAGNRKQAEAAPAAEQNKKSDKKKPPKVTWIGAADATEAGREMHSKAQVGDWKVELGVVVLLPAEEAGEDGQEQHVFGMVQCMWQDEDGDKMAQVRMLVPGLQTVLGDAGADAELFVTDEYEEVSLTDVAGLVNAKRLQREFDPDLRGRQFKEDEALRKHNAEAKAAGRSLEYFYRHLYLPEQGMFRALPATEDLKLGTYHEEPEEPIELAMLPAGKGFIKDGVEYRVGDFLYVQHDTFDAAEQSESEAEGDESEQEDKENKTDLPAYASKMGRFHKGSCAGLRAWGLARLLDVKEAGSNGRSNKDKAALPGKLRLQRYYRPEDIGKDEAYKADFWDVYATPEPTSSSSTTEDWVQWVDVDDVIRKCAAKAVGAPVPQGCEELDCFEVKGTYHPVEKKISSPPKDFAAADDMEVDGGADQQQQQDEDDGLALATMDIFAGCGGLSEGMHQAKVADTKWAIEYEQPAADAFKLNNPKAAVFCNNCNVILVAAMTKAGLEDDCAACDDARTAAAAMTPEDVAALPKPGDVEFIMGGPPCQGYSGMNRFNKGNWSMVQNSMVMSFLSFCDFYRPRYFLLENVRNFVSHNKSFTFRLTLRTLLDMGYQVRFGVLNAGNFGVPQSRKRTFIWAAAPDEDLPNWPKPRHVFRSPQLTVNLPGGVAYCAVDTSIPGAPLRTVTVRDAIGDLPPIENGHNQDVMEYTGPAASAFQKLMRSKATQLRDHICKEMNPLNLERCRCIPKETPGADWRVLLELVKNDPSREKFNGQPLVPWCLPNTAERHNGWRGLFGRLDLAGHFPTSTTDPQPMGKVGQVFHPSQDRIVSVRECARSQGFPDHFFFSGNVHNRHRQVGNAVPPPLAASLGRQLRQALEQKRAQQLANLQQ